jgi:uncharacterized membrane protein YhhN
MNYLFLLAALAVAVLDWLAVAKSWKPLEYVAKPGVMVALALWLWQAGAFSSHLAWFALGLVFSLLGDVFLMLPREQFIPGLVSFLLAHLAYLVGFNASLPSLNAASLLLALLVATTSVQIYRGVSAGLVASGSQGLKGPVLAYSAVISLMLLAALLTLLRSDWNTGAAVLASAGAFLFFLSDTFLAWNKFVKPLPLARLRVIVSYHLGQLLIVLGAALHFLA